MNVRSLSLENVRGFKGQHEIDFEDRNVSTFIGVNGAGKSTVVECIAICLQRLVGLYTDVFSDYQLPFNSNDITNGAAKAKFSISFDRHGRAPGPAVLQCVKTLEKAVTIGTRNTKDLTDLLQQAWVSNDREVPVFGYYQTNHPVQARDSSSDTVQIKISRNLAYFNAFNPVISFDKIILWFAHQVNLQNSEIIRREDFNYLIPSVKSVRDGLSVFLATLEGTEENVGVVELGVERGKQVFTYVKGSQRLNFTQLSSGEKLVIGLAMDIMYRCLAANPHLDNALASKGVVLIDEIELHLHPRWQANIIGALTATFPNIHFIISTHSPLVINQLKPKQLFILNDNSIIPGTSIQNTYGMDVNSVIAEIMGGSYRPKKITKTFEQIEQLLDDPKPKNLDTAKALLQELSTKISPNDSELLQLQSLLKLEESEADY